MTTLFPVATGKILLRPFRLEDAAAKDLIDADPDIKKCPGTPSKLEDDIAAFEHQVYGLVAIVDPGASCDRLSRRATSTSASPAVTAYEDGKRRHAKRRMLGTTGRQALRYTACVHNHDDAAARNYIYFGGGTITFGKLTMRDADLQLIDADPADPFDFFPARYNAQLVAGYSKNTPTRGLKTYMPDFDDLAKPRR